MLAYIDTSAFLKLVFEESESRALREHLDAVAPVLVASRLLYTEVVCALARQRVQRSAADREFDSLLLVELEAVDLREAAGLERLRAADALHLATALRVEASHLISYDHELLEAAGRRHLVGVAPGATA